MDVKLLVVDHANTTGAKHSNIGMCIEYFLIKGGNIVSKLAPCRATMDTGEDGVVIEQVGAVAFTQYKLKAGVIEIEALDGECGGVVIMKIVRDSLNILRRGCTECFKQ